MQQFPFPIISIQVDGGSEFMAEFEQTCQKLNIPLFVLPPKSPKYNGKVERSNRTAREEFYRIYDQTFKISSIRTKLAEYILKYNTYRPHAALNNKTPMAYYNSTFLKVG